MVYKITKEPIEKAQRDKVTDAIQKVVPAFDNQPDQTKVDTTFDGGEMTVYTAQKEGQTVGYAIETFSPKGFGGPIRLMIGFLPDGTIHKIEVLSHSETPGLGNKIERSKSDFSVQFEGKNPATFQLAVKKDGGDVDAITASTISSRAFSDAVDRAYRLFQTITESSNE